MAMEVMDNGNVVFIERRGNIKLFDAAIGKSKIICKIENFHGNHDGLLGIALDPKFNMNKFLYLFYTPAALPAVYRLSRFEFENDSIPLSTEKVVFEMPGVHTRSSHSAGSLAFDAKGNLFISTGDNTIESGSDGYAPIDEIKGREIWDAQRTSANTNDLRGKILRIHPEENGSYTIPAGNLFPKDGSAGKPEIFIMGNRNPFRISVDQKSGFLYWGEVGPDAGKDSLGRGPKGYDEINQARQPGNYGWPYFVGPNLPYNAYDFEAKKQGLLFDSSAPVNSSINNTGERILPPAQKAFIWYPYDTTTVFPDLKFGGRMAMAGPVYRKDPKLISPRGLPEYFNGKLFIYDWMRYWIKVVNMDENGNYLGLDSFLDSLQFVKPIDMKIARNGVMYVLEYGSFWGSQNTDSKLTKIEYWANNRPPVAKATANKLVGAVPLKVNFSSKSSFDPDLGSKLKYEWNLGTGIPKVKTPNPVYSYSRPGSYKVVLTVTDEKGEKAKAELNLAVGDNDPAVIQLKNTKNSSFYKEGQPFDYRILVFDKEDGKSNLKKNVAENVKVLLKVVPQANPSKGIYISDEFVTGANLLNSNDCLTCHAMERKSVGPSFKDISAKYSNSLEITNLLANKIIKGGGGVWGNTAMSAHPLLQEDQAAQMVKYILSIKNLPAEKKVPLTGTLDTLGLASEKTRSMFVFNTSYKDSGGKKSPPIEVKQQFTVRNHKLSTKDYDAAMGISQKAGANPFVYFVKSGDYIMFKNIDLTSIKSLNLRVKHGDMGGIDDFEGRLSVRIDSVNGRQISLIKSTPIPIMQNKYHIWKEVNALVEKTDGFYDLFFVYEYHNSRIQLSWDVFGVDWIDFIF